jgi:hypothetical protein
MRFPFTNWDRPIIFKTVKELDHFQIVLVIKIAKQYP